MSEIPEYLGKSANPEYVIDYSGIAKVLPHRYPFLLVDGVREFESGIRIVGQKNVTFNEPFFNGHFPSEPVMPGVLQIEALAQLSCLLVMISFEEAKGKRPAFAGIEEAKFRRPVRPGDVMILSAELQSWRRGFGILKTQGMVGGQMAVEAIIKAAMV